MYRCESNPAQLDFTDMNPRGMVGFLDPMADNFLTKNPENFRNYSLKTTIYTI